MRLLNNLSLFGDTEVKNGLIMLQESWTEKIQTYICYKFNFMVLLEKGAFELPHSKTP